MERPGRFCSATGIRLRPFAGDSGRPISPDGTKVATIGAPAEQRVISIAPIDGAQPKLIGLGKAVVRSVRWAGDDHILVRSSALDRFTNNAAGGTFSYHLDRDFVLTADGKVKGVLLQNDPESNLLTGLPVAGRRER